MKNSKFAYEILTDGYSAVVNFYRSSNGEFCSSWRLSEPSDFAEHDAEKIKSQLAVDPTDLSGFVSGRQNDCYLDRDPNAASYFKSWNSK